MIARLIAIAFLFATLVGAPLAQQPAPQPVPQPAPQPAPAQQPPRAQDPDRFEADIAKFEEADRTNPLPPGSIIFTGSSSIRRWTNLGTDFPGLPVVNRGFGGSTYPDLVRYAERLTVAAKPRMVVFYSGDNDVSRGRTAAQIEADVRTIAEKLHKALPQTRLVFISIKPSLARWKYVEVTRDANARIKKFVDVFPQMLGADGQPRPELFVEDGLHLTRAGEAIWTAALDPVLRPKT
jgi:lysophospholipase L1-like esterase